MFATLPLFWYVSTNAYGNIVFKSYMCINLHYRLSHLSAVL